MALTAWLEPAATNDSSVRLATTRSVAGALPAGAFALSTAPAEADDRIIYDQATGFLYFDVDGGSRANQVQFATLSNLAVITADDFLVI